jgi:hypothetical protein
VEVELTERGWSAEHLANLRQTLIDAIPQSISRLEPANADRIDSIMAAASIVAELEQAINIRTDKLSATVRVVSSAERANLDALRAEVEVDFASGAASLEILRHITALIDESARLLLDSNNMDALRGDLDYAFGALMDFQSTDWTPQRLRQHVSDLQTADSIGSALADDLRTIADGTAAELVAGDFVAAGRSLTSFAYAARAATGIAPAVRQELEDYALLLRDFLDPFPWQNDLNPLHVDDDAQISPNDALMVINWLNTGGAEDLPSPLDTLHKPHAHIDTTGDNRISPLDALLVINWLNNSDEEGEGELAATADAVPSISRVAGVAALLGTASEDSPAQPSPGNASRRTLLLDAEQPGRGWWTAVWTTLTQRALPAEDDAPVSGCLAADEIDAALAEWDGLSLESLLD